VSTPNNDSASIVLLHANVTVKEIVFNQYASTANLPPAFLFLHKHLVSNIDGISCKVRHVSFKPIICEHQVGSLLVMLKPELVLRIGLSEDSHSASNGANVIIKVIPHDKDWLRGSLDHDRRDLAIFEEKGLVVESLLSVEGMRKEVLVGTGRRVTVLEG